MLQREPSTEHRVDDVRQMDGIAANVGFVCVAGWTGTAGLRTLLGDVAQLCSCSSGWPGPHS